MNSTIAATMSTSPTPVDRARAMWALGDYPAVAHEVVAEIGRTTVAAAGVAAHDAVIDVAAGTGNAAIPAAQTGARVTATDITPELLEVGRREAEALGLPIEWRNADAQALPYDDDAFDVALSTVGVMFAPGHQECADELVRVVRPGGRIALASWTPQGLSVPSIWPMKPYLPPPPAGSLPGTLWGEPDHVTALFGDRVEDLRSERRVLRVTCFDHPDAFRDFFKTKYGPTIVAYRGLGDDAQRVSALDRDLSDLAARHDVGRGAALAMEWEYLLVTARIPS